MKRKIIFRGKTIDNKRWVYGDLKIFEGCYIGYTIEIVHFDEGKQNSYIEVEVIPESVGQFTGFKTKNESFIYDESKEMYEGDIITKGGKNKYIIIYDEYGFRGISNEGDEYVPYSFNFKDGYDRDKLKIVGNITDNPELFKK